MKYKLTLCACVRASSRRLCLLNKVKFVNLRNRSFPNFIDKMLGWIVVGQRATGSVLPVIIVTKSNYKHPSSLQFGPRLYGVYFDLSGATNNDLIAYRS